MTVAPLNLMSAHPWQHVVFTTYALSLSFFEAVIVDALLRGGAGAQPLILADVHGVRESLSEQGAHRVGKDYEVEPVAVSGGVFHPKISVLASADECHLLVGSGNLTFNGWGGNCEILEHLHPGFAPDAIADAADFFDLLPASNRVRQGAADRCAAIANTLRRAVLGRPRNGNIRLLHNLDSSLAEQIAQTAADLGGALRFVVVAPFWDSGIAIDRVCQSIGVHELFVHAHLKGTVEGIAGANWPRGARTPIRPVRLAVLNAPQEATRPLHAKAFEILCRRGRLLVSGSANATGHALERDRNVEACVVRIHRERTVGWTYIAAEPPGPQAQAEKSEDDNQKRAGVLRAVLNGDEVSGQVLTPRMSGPASVYHIAAIGPELLAETTLDPEGAFTITTPSLEKWSWRGGRLVLRVRDSEGRHAEGFVSVASFAEIARRGGAVTRRLFALIFGNETPEDVVAILNWFHEDPHRLAPPDPESIRGGGKTERDDDSERLIPVTALGGNYVDALAATKPAEDSGHRNWSRFLDQILAAFREPRGPFDGTDTNAPGEDEEDEEQRDDQRKNGGKDPTIDKAYAAFERLFAILTKDGGPVRNAVIAFELTGYICGRLRPDPDKARAWLERVIRVQLSAGVEPARRDDVAAAILTVLGTAPEPGLCRWARGCLLRLGVDFSGPPPSADGARNYQFVLLQQEDFAALWTRLHEIRTYPEQVRSFLEALKCGKPAPDDYPDLPLEAPEEWPALEAALSSPNARTTLLFANGSGEACPVHHISLPAAEIHKLRSTGIATTKNCCRKVVIRQGA